MYGMKFDLYGHVALMINHGIIVIGLCTSQEKITMIKNKTRKYTANTDNKLTSAVGPKIRNVNILIY